MRAVILGILFLVAGSMLLVVGWGTSLLDPLIEAAPGTYFLFAGVLIGLGITFIWLRRWL